MSGTQATCERHRQVDGVGKHRANRPPAGRRVAAAVSLLTLVAAAGLLLVGVVVHLGAVLLALACLLICVIAGWYVVSRRGFARAVAAVVMVAALGGLATGLAFANLNLLALVLVIAVSAMSVVSARYALRARPAGAAGSAGAPADAARLSAAARPRRPVLVMNLKSGGGKAERFRLAEECARRGIEPVVLRPGDDLQRLADDAVSRGADVIGMAGGDGSQALVATVASRRGIPHVCVPAGTRNHFALDLGLDRDDVVGALDAFTDGVERQVDLAAVNGRVFVNNASLGLYAKVIQSPEYRDAKLSTAASVLPAVLGPEAKPLDLRFRGPDGDHPDAHLILVSNDPYQLDTIGGMGTRERLDLGVLGIRRGQDRRRRSGQPVHGARGGRAGPPLPRLAGVGHVTVRGQLGRPGRDRDRRRGAAAGSAAGVRVAAGRAAGPAAAPRGAGVPGCPDGAAAVRLDDQRACRGGGGAAGALTGFPGCAAGACCPACASCAAGACCPACASSPGSFASSGMPGVSGWV
jgi:hypothetical protein